MQRRDLRAANSAAQQYIIDILLSHGSLYTHLSLIMVGRAKSKEQKRREYVAVKEKWMERAMEAYRCSQDSRNDLERKGRSRVCAEMSTRCLEEDNVEIHLDKQTLSRRLQGIKSQAKSNAQRGWLTEEEEQVIVDFSISVANQGFPLSQKRIQEHAEELCRAHYGPDFERLGETWGKRFLARHRKVLGAYWSHPLDHSRARAGNHHTKKAFYDLLEQVIKGTEDKEPIPTHLIYATDETGFQEGIGTRERVYGAAGKKVQHQQRSGVRENTTAIVTICADGSSLPPAIIFKGEGYQASWEQENPLNAS